MREIMQKKVGLAPKLQIALHGIDSQCIISSVKHQLRLVTLAVMK